MLRLQTLADERELTVEKVQKREDNSSEKAAASSCGIMVPLMTDDCFSGWRKVL